MGKKGLSDKVRSKRKNKAKQPPNPFEVKVNKIKHAVVNKKVQKWEKGLPGVSRSKAVKKRKDTLLRELHHIKKSNSLHDKRFGESDGNLTADEKMVQRFALEKKKQLRKGDFNLNEDEEVLTHYGQSLAENLQDTIGSDSDDDGDGANLRTGNLQFGGFSKEGDEQSYKDKMKEVIADSKKQKYERQMEKEKTLEATQELDKSWKTVVSSLKPAQDNKKKPSNFMQLFHNLVMEQKSAGASDKLKSEEEKAKEEAEKLKLMEAARIARMKGTTKKSKASTHVSADDLNDGFSFDRPKKKVVFADEEVEEEDEEEEGEKKEDEKDDSDDEEGNKEEKNEEEEEEEEDESEGEEESDNYSDLASDDDDDDDDDEDDESEEDEDEPPAGKGKDRKSKSILKKSELKPNPEDKTSSVSPVKSSLPFVYTAPGSYEELVALLHGHSGEEQAVILSRLRKCHHPSLAEGNKEKLEKIHTYLLQYFGKLLTLVPVDKQLVHQVTSNLWEMTQMFPASTASALQELVMERQKSYWDAARRRAGRGVFPSLDTLMYLKLVESLFPASDFRHPVTTPAMHFITQLLAECPVRCCKDLVSGLFVCALALKYVSLSKRFVPELVTFLHGLLYLAVNKTEVKDIQVFPPFRSVGKAVDLLEVQEKCPSIDSEWSLSELLHQETSALETNQFRCTAVSKVLALLQECVTLWADLPCLAAVMEPVKQLLPLLPAKFYPSGIKTQIDSLRQKLEESATKTLRVMELPAKKPMPLKLFEPQFDEFWAGKRKKGGPNREVNERQRLTHKYKREMKAAIREIKRDNEVLARHQLDTVMAKDTERKRKTKDLLNSLANQEGDFNALKRFKK